MDSNVRRKFNFSLPAEANIDMTVKYRENKKIQKKSKKDKKENIMNESMNFLKVRLNIHAIPHYYHQSRVAIFKCSFRQVLHSLFLNVL